jgi:hypothetical protein
MLGLSLDATEREIVLTTSQLGQSELRSDRQAITSTDVASTV